MSALQSAAPGSPATGASTELRAETHAPTISGREWRFVALVALGLLLLTTIPYLYAQLTAPADRHFMGMMLDVPDHLQYFSWMRELTYAPLAANKLTPEPNPPVFFNLLWWGLGRAGALLGLGYAAMFQVLRWLSAPIFLALVYRMAALIFATPFERKVAFLIVALGSGLGWLLVVAKYTITNGVLVTPLDLYVAEGNTFHSLLGYPHFIAAALYISVFDVMLRHGRTQTWRAAVGAGLLALFFGWQHAYDLIIVWAVLGAWLLLCAWRDRRIEWRMAGALVVIGVISVWPALYSVLLTRLSPLWEEVLAQFANAGVFTPPPWRLPMLMGIPLLLALAQALREKPWRRDRLAAMSDATIFLHGWFWISFVLIYLPVDYQIHMLNGWQVPIGFFAAKALFTWIAPAVSARWATPGSKRSLQPLLAALLILVILPTNLYLFAWRFIDLRRYDMPYYLTTDEMRALDWLETHAAGDDVVFSALDFGQYVPAQTGAHAYLAHWAQTVDFYHKQAAVSTFYAAEETPAANQARIATLDAQGVDWVVAGPSEHELGAFDPAALSQLTPVFSSPTVTIYAYAAQ